VVAFLALGDLVLTQQLKEMHTWISAIWSSNSSVDGYDAEQAHRMSDIVSIVKRLVKARREERGEKEYHEGCMWKIFNPHT
jgi:hypothetical protein